MSDKSDYEASLEASIAKLVAALKPFAAMPLSTDPQISDCLYRSPAEHMRRMAEATERRDADILSARDILADQEGCGA